MHASYEQLLAVRDSSPVQAEISQHVNFCMLCRERLDEITGVRDGLRQLPEMHPEGNHWPGILDRVQRERSAARPRSTIRLVAAFGLAATLTLAIALYLLSGDHPAHQQADPAIAGTDLQQQAVTKNDTGIGNSEQEQASEVSLDELIYQSRYLEAVLDSLPKRPRVMRASTTTLISGLQDGVALVDYQLNAGTGEFTDTQTRQLWQQRVDLMNSLVYVRAAEAQQVAYIPN